MATATVTPTATPAAPATPAVSTTAPVPAATTPAAPPTPPPAETQAPAVAQPAIPSTIPASTPTAAAKPEPKQADFPGDVQGFLDAHHAWENDAEPEEAKPAEADTTAAPTEAPTEAAPTAETTDDAKPADEEEKPWAAEPEAPLTPEAVNGWLEKNATFKAALEESPELKNQIFSMARVNAKAAPLLDLFPNVESAQFAADAANRFVGLKSGFERTIDDPEATPDAFRQLAEEFIVHDKDGNIVTDEAGDPVVGEDFHHLANYVVDTYLDSEIADLNAAVEAGKFGSDAEKERAEMALSALQFVKEIKDGSPVAKPDVSALPDDVRGYFEARERELTEREAALNQSSSAQSREAAKQKREGYERDVRQKIGGAVGKRIKDYMAEKENAGIYIPSYVTETRDPQTGISNFAKTIFDQFQKKVNGTASIQRHLRQLEMLPPSNDAAEQRTSYALTLIDQFVPEIIDRELREIQKRDIADRSRRPHGAPVAEREPRGGATPRPQVLTDEQAMEKARTMVAEQYPDASPAERLAHTLMKRRELLGVR